MSGPVSYVPEPVKQDGALIDIRVRIQGKIRHMWGRGGVARELDLANSVRPGELPVLIGSGLGAGLAILLKRGFPVAVADRESDILALTKLDALHEKNSRVLWLSRDPAEAMKQLDAWRKTHGGTLRPLVSPLYPGLDRGYYGGLAVTLKQGDADPPRPGFRNRDPRILLLTSQYFLLGEITAACERMDIPHLFVNLGQKSLTAESFVKTVTEAVASFRPDFVFTVNHLGVDREGVLLSLLERLGLPLASWFVDNPHLILYLYPRIHSPNTVIFTWDADNIPALRERGFENLHHLPLAADVTRFKPGMESGAHPEWKSRVSFVGNSMVAKTAHRLKAARPPKPLLTAYRELAREFGEQPEPSVQAFLAHSRPEMLPHFQSLGTMDRKLAFETLVTWEATRQYRKACVEQILPFSPLIVGDRGWTREFEGVTGWRYHAELGYYEDLPGFYPLSTVNFNCTSRQMKGAVNQRVFDVPASGAFLLTDERRQMENLFEPGREVATYASVEDIPEQIQRWLDDDSARQALVHAARKRVLAEHTYEHRVRSMIETMRQTFC